MGLLGRIFGKKDEKSALYLEVGTKIFKQVHGNFNLKIMQDIGGNSDGNTEQEAYMEVTEMILRGDLDRNNLQGLCEAYMQIRENIITNNGGMPRWVAK